MNPSTAKKGGGSILKGLTASELLDERKNLNFDEEALKELFLPSNSRARQIG